MPDTAKYWIILGLFIVGAQFGGLNRSRVSPVDSSIRADIARHIERTGELFPPTYLGRELIDHPPLYVWSLALSMKVFGENAFAVNFPNRLFSSLVLILIALFGFFWVKSPWVGLISALLILCNREWMLITARGGIEPQLTALTLFSVLGLIKVGKNTDPTQQILWGAFSGLMAGLTILSKGPPGLWPVVFGIAWLLAGLSYNFWKDNHSSRWNRGLLGYVSAIFGFGICFWIWIQYFDPTQYWSRYFSQQVISSAVEGRGGQGWDFGYFFNIFFKKAFPLQILAPFAMYFLFKKRRLLAPQIHGMWILALGFFVGFSLVRWKFNYYITPMYPPLTLAFTAAIYSGLPTNWLSRLKRYEKGAIKTLLGIGAVFATVMVVFPITVSLNRYPWMDELKPFIQEARRDLPASGRYLEIYDVGTGFDHNSISTLAAWSWEAEVKTVRDLLPSQSPNQQRMFYLLFSRESQIEKALVGLPSSFYERGGIVFAQVLANPAGLKAVLEHR